MGGWVNFWLSHWQHNHSGFKHIGHAWHSTRWRSQPSLLGGAKWKNLPDFSSFLRYFPLLPIFSRVLANFSLSRGHSAPTGYATDSAQGSNLWTTLTKVGKYFKSKLKAFRFTLSGTIATIWTDLNRLFKLLKAQQSWFQVSRHTRF